ncbi:acetyl-CoA C-acetyltransferase [Streptomyces sp. NPDC046853]|uniref:acetyl-CoA C-acetyltransferase n=1 Tax=Streptomyces sp. NPDC046853 TaxID=3154920 RepID=UPI0033ED320C
MSEAFIYDAIRTPRGRGRDGALRHITPLSLVTGLIDELGRRLPGLDPGRLDDVVLGVATPVGDQGMDLAKAAALAAGLPDHVTGVQLNRLGASGLEAVNFAAQTVRSGWEHLVLAGGVESMSRVPMESDGCPMADAPGITYDLRFVPQGIGADLIATLGGFTREDVDTFAVRSQNRAAAAWSGGYFAKSVVPVRDRGGVIVLEQDEPLCPDTTLETLGRLTSSFADIGDFGRLDAVALEKYPGVERIEHVHTPGNSSGIADGAALVLIGSEQAGVDLGLAPRARIVSTALSGADPTIMLTGPAPATRKALDLAGLTVADIDLFEINETFASVVLRYVEDLGLSWDKINVNGGAIAMGHPLGATGAMLVNAVVDELERRCARRAVVSLCAGGGMGIATVVERL